MGRSATNADGEGSSPSGGTSETMGRGLGPVWPPKPGVRGSIPRWLASSCLGSSMAERLIRDCSLLARFRAEEGSLPLPGVGSGFESRPRLCFSCGRHDRWPVTCLSRGRAHSSPLARYWAKEGRFSGSNPTPATALLAQEAERRLHKPEATVRLGQGAPYPLAQVHGTGRQPGLRNQGPRRACGFDSRPEHSLRLAPQARLEWPPVCRTGDRGFESRRGRLQDHGSVAEERGTRLQTAAPRCDSGVDPQVDQHMHHRARTRPGLPKAGEAVRLCPVVPDIDANQPARPCGPAERRQP